MTGLVGSSAAGDMMGAQLVVAGATAKALPKVEGWVLDIGANIGTSVVLFLAARVAERAILVIPILFSFVFADASAATVPATSARVAVA